MTIPGYAQFGGKHSETAVLRNILGFLGVVAPHTGEPYSEAMLLGLGGGLGGGYFSWEFASYELPILIVGTRHSWENSQKFLQTIGERLSLPMGIRETSSGKAAAGQLREALAEGRPAIAWVDQAHLSYHFLPEWMEKGVVHVVGVCGLDERSGAVRIDDRAPVPWTVEREEFAVARAAITSNRHRLAVVGTPTEEVDLKTAVEEAILSCCHTLTEPTIRNFGLPAIAKWADLMANRRDKKGWPTVFPPGPPLYAGLTAIFHSVETSGTGGGAFRPMYADFLEEASGLLDRPALEDVARQYRELGTMWSAFAAAALPDSIEPFKRARELMVRKNELFQGRGVDALAELGQTHEQLDDVQAEIREAFPLSPAETRDFLADVSGRLWQVHAAECEAVVALMAAVS